MTVLEFDIIVLILLAIFDRQKGDYATPFGKWCMAGGLFLLVFYNLIYLVTGGKL